MSTRLLAVPALLLLIAGPFFLMQDTRPAEKPAPTDWKPGDAPQVTVRLLDDQGGLTAPLTVPKTLRTDEQWQARLSPEQYRILRNKGTERAFCGLLWDHHEAGTYCCRGCGLPLFSSEHKFESGTGWPSYWQPVAPENVSTKRDVTFGMARTEILCTRCDGHLGHVFDDGPPPSGQRHCLNSESLVFVPAARLATEPEGGHACATAIFAAGCFWGVEEVFRTTPGVLSTAVGYTGGQTEKPTYEQVCGKGTGHAEAVRVEYDPQAVSYLELLTVFFRNHDPTQVNRQGPDFGDQYRTAIFTLSEEQRETATRVKAMLDDSKPPRPIATQIVPAGTFWMAEEYHQQYLKKSGQAQCHTP